MDKSKEIIIDKFLRGELTKEEQELFDNYMLEEDFVVQLDRYQEMIVGLKDADVHDMKQVLKGIEKNIGNNKTNTLKGIKSNGQKRIKLMRWFNKIAAVLVFLLLIVGVNYLQDTSPSLEQIYENYYDPYPNIVDPITKGDNSNIASIYQLYEMMKYDNVINRLEVKNNLSSHEQFYLASSYLATEQFELASKRYDMITDTDDFHQAAQWYQALICLKQNQENCKLLFIHITSDINHVYYSKAKLILKDI